MARSFKARGISHKYNARKTIVDNIIFPSMREARRYSDLKNYKLAGLVSHFLRQVPFHLPGGVTYRLDFLVFWADGNVTYEDTKGFKTSLYIAKKKMVEDLYPIKITEV
jgi:hypothetical protein